MTVSSDVKFTEAIFAMLNY